MSLWKIAWRSIQQRALASWLTGLSMALGVALIVFVLVVHGTVSRSFSEAAQGYNLILGKKGSSTQLLLNTVFHLQKPIENLPWEFYKQIKGDKSVEVAVPFCLGDMFQEFRVVGTNSDMFKKLNYGSTIKGDPKKYRCAHGRFFADSKEDYFTAVIGAIAARKAGLSVGQKIQVAHGLAEEVDPKKVERLHQEIEQLGARLESEAPGSEAAEDIQRKLDDKLAQLPHSHDEKFEIVGILEPTGTPNDRAVFINIEGFFLMGGHAKDKPEEPAHGAKPADEKNANAKSADKRAADEHNDHHDEHKESDGVKSKDVAQGSGPATATAPQGTEAGHEPKGEHPPEEKHAPGKHEHHDHDHGDHDHDHHNHEPLPEDQREVTAILVAMPDGPLGDVSALHMYTKVNEGVTAQAIFPIREVRSLMEGLVGTARWLLLVLSGLVVIVAGIGVMVSIYNSMSDRRRDIAIMRSLGASRGSVMLVILLEAIMLSLLGGLAGVVLAHGTIGALEGLLVRLTGVSMNPFQVEPLELIIIPGLILLASLVGYLPALSAYRTDVAKALTSAP